MAKKKQIDPGELAVRFFERCLTHTKGKYAKKPFLLRPFQQRIVRDIFGTLKKNGLRQYDTAYVEMPKKNGKSELAAGVALIGLFIDNEPGAEIYSAAATRDQAGLVFKVAAQMVRNNPALLDLVKIVDSTKTIYLKSDPSSFYKAISADVGTQDGINPHFVIFDELHRQKHRELWDVLTMSSDTREQPLLFAITTAGISDESPICWEQHEYARQILEGVFHDPSFYPVIYALPPEADWEDEGHPAKGNKPATGWFATNPALGDFLRLDKVRQLAAAAKRVPSKQNSFRRFRLCQWVAQETKWLSLIDWDKGAEPFNPNDLLGKPCYGGLDLSTTRDITAFVLVFQGDEGEVFVLPEFWIPGHDIQERSKRDRVTYDLWAKQGLIHVTDGNAIDYNFIRKRINELGELYDIQEIGNDPWNATQIAADLAETDGFTMVPIRQGFASMSPPSKELERLVTAEKLRHGGHPILRWMMDCTTVKNDHIDNIRPVKPERLKTTKRIDGIVATIMGIGRMSVQPEYKAGIYTPTRGIISI